MRILKSAVSGFAGVILAFAIFAGIVWLYSGYEVGFSSGVHLDARAICGHVSIRLARGRRCRFYRGLLLALSSIDETHSMTRGETATRESASELF
jgi:hypothetical protein